MDPSLQPWTFEPLLTLVKLFRDRALVNAPGTYTNDHVKAIQAALRSPPAWDYDKVRGYVCAGGHDESYPIAFPQFSSFQFLMGG
jgi:hypothetical protein